MEEKKEALVLEQEDLLGFTVKQITCVDCIKGYCPSRTPALCDNAEFILCGARKNVQPVLAAYTKRTGTELHIERPC